MCSFRCTSIARIAVLGALAAFLQELAIPWLVIGDFQGPPSQWEGHHLLSVLKAELVCSGQPTLVNGAELDYLLASRSIAPFIDHIKANWDVPWKPYAGLVITIDKAAPRLALQQLTCFPAVPKLDEAIKQWDDFTPAPKPFWLGRPVGPKEVQYAEWCHHAEEFVLQNLHEPKQGRGWYLALEAKLLPVTKPLSPWRKGDLAYCGHSKEEPHQLRGHGSSESQNC